MNTRTITHFTNVGRGESPTSPRQNQYAPKDNPLTRTLSVAYWVLAAFCALGGLALVIMGFGALSKIVWNLLIRGWTTF